MRLYPLYVARFADLKTIAIGLRFFNDSVIYNLHSTESTASVMHHQD